MKHRINTLVFASLITLTCLFLRDFRYFIPLLILIAVVYLTILSLGVLFMQYNYFLKSTTRLKNSLCLLTFDDGPDPVYTAQILDVLAKHGIKAIFFVIGEMAMLHPELTKRIKTEGHLIGNHSYSHNNFMSMFSKSRLKEEISKAQDELESLLGERPVYFRPPIGYTNPKYAIVLRELKLKCVGWTLRSYDSVYKDAEKLSERLTKKIKPGNIVLMHDNLRVSAEALDSFIVQAKGNGIIFASQANIKSILNA